MQGADAQPWAAIVREGRNTSTLLSFEEEMRRVVRACGARRGKRTVETSRILGSVGKNEWFDEDFAPLGDASRERWKRINRGIPARARVSSREPLPVGGRVYFVRDGHHQVGVARFHGFEGWTPWSRSSGRRRARWLCWPANTARTWRDRPLGEARHRPFRSER